MQVKFRTLTPIFTGNAEGNQGRLRESGLIGSLRFWAGATARGLGYELAGDNKNPPDVNTVEDTEKLDPVTGVFGCTGWKRIFQMKIFEPRADNVNILIPSEEVHVQARNHGWTLKPGCLFPWNKPVLINHIFRRPLSQKWETEGMKWLALVWRIIDRLCGIGAHQGWGYGQIRLTNELAINDSIEVGKKFDDTNHPINKHLPDLADFVFAEYEFPPNEKVQLRGLSGRNNFFNHRKAPIARDCLNTPSIMKPIGLSLRYLLHHGDNSAYVPPLKKWGADFFGDSRKGLPAGRFHGSFLYLVNKHGKPDIEGDRFRFRVWAWLPKSVFESKTRRDIPNWCEAALMLREELCSKDLWRAIADCNPPKECYFWPLTPSQNKPELKPLFSILEQIEKRSAGPLGRCCLQSNGKERGAS